MDRYRLISKLGEGTYGVVYKANDLKTGKVVALKYIRLEIDDKTGGIPSTALREISLLGQLDHPNIIRLYDIILLEKQCILSFEFISHDLKALMDSMAPTPFDPFTVKSFIFQLLQGVAYCHRNYIMHRDLKPQNLLVDDNAILKVADFGLARPFSPTLSKYSAEVVTLWYRAPELLLGQEDYDSSVDIWSVGCIMCELVNGTPLFTGASEYSQLKAIFSLLGTPEDDDGGDNFGINNGNGGDSGQFDREKKNKDKGSEENGNGGKTEGGVGHGPNQVSTNEGSKDNTTNRVNKDGKGNLRSGPVGLAGNSRKIDKESINSLPGYKEFLSHHSMAMKNDEKKPTDDSLLQKNTKNDQNSDPSIIKQHRTLPFPTPHGDICIPPTPWEQICPRLQGVGLDLLSKLLTLNPRLRISADEALTHPFFADLIVVNAEDFEHVK